MRSNIFSSKKIVEILFYTFPLSFIIGNLALTLHLLIFIAFSFFFIINKKLTIRFNNSSWLLVAFFLYFIISTIIQYQSPGLLNEKAEFWSYRPISKSILLTRYLFLIIILDILFYNNILKLKNFFLTSLFCTIFVSLDIILQYITGTDLFGLKNEGVRNSGPFGEEKIAGSYLQKISFFSFFYIMAFFKNNNQKKLLLIFIVALNSIAMILAHNKMPILLLIFGYGLVFLFIKKLRIQSISAFIILLVTFFLIIENNQNIKQRYGSFINTIITEPIAIKIKKFESTKVEKSIKDEKQKKDINYLFRTGHNQLFRAAIKIWKEQPIFGFGYKSFRIKCWRIRDAYNKDIKPELVERLGLKCANHPHNFYLELLAEAGIIGISLIIIFFLTILKYSLLYLIKYNEIKYSEKYLLIPIVITFILEIWPIKSSGALFSTWSGTSFWLIVGITFAAINKAKSKI